jgi:hypothetical protein
MSNFPLRRYKNLQGALYELTGRKDYKYKKKDPICQHAKLNWDKDLMEHKKKVKEFKQSNPEEYERIFNLYIKKRVGTTGVTKRPSEKLLSNLTNTKEVQECLGELDKLHEQSSELRKRLRSLLNI